MRTIKDAVFYSLLLVLIAVLCGVILCVCSESEGLFRTGIATITVIDSNSVNICDLDANTVNIDGTATIDYLDGNSVNIEYLDANYVSITVTATIDYLDGNSVNIEYIDANYATITGTATIEVTDLNISNICDLDANTVNITGTATIDYLDGNSVNIEYLDANYCTITGKIAIEDLDANTAHISFLDANIVEIRAGSITGIDDITITDGGTGASDAATARSNLGLSGFLIGDGTDGRVIRAIKVYIEDGTDANTIKVSTIDQFNGDVISAEDNLAKSGSTTSFSLAAGGIALTIESTAITGNCVGVLASSVPYNDDPNFAGCLVSASDNDGSNDIVMALQDGSDGSDFDLTTIAAGKTIGIYICYVTSE